MSSSDDLQRWWDRLGEKDRAEVRRVRETGEVSDHVLDSLRRAGLVKDKKVPDEVDIFLKARH